MGQQLQHHGNRHEHDRFSLGVQHHQRGNSWGFITPGQDARALFVSTLIVHRAGDLYGFNLAFSVPEPATWTLLVGGFAALCTFRRRRRENLNRFLGFPVDLQ